MKTYTLDPINGRKSFNGYYSQTTMTHINSFLNHVGKPTMSKKELV